MSMFCRNILVPFIPTDGAPAATAARAYSIWTSFPEGLQHKQNNTIVIVSLQQQECISVGSVPYTAVAVRGGGGCPRGSVQGRGWGCLPGGGVYPSMHWSGGASAPVHAGIHPPTHTHTLVKHYLSATSLADSNKRSTEIYHNQSHPQLTFARTRRN